MRTWNSAIALSVMMAGVALAENGAPLVQQDVIHVARTAEADDKIRRTIASEPNMSTAVAVRISGYVRAKGVTGPPGRGFGVVTNLTYDKTPVFWDTLMFPATGTSDWQYVERNVGARRPIRKIETSFIFERLGEAWFRDFRVEVIDDPEDDAEQVVAMLGDSTDMIAYLPRELGVGHRLELLLRDRFHNRHIQVRNLAESGDHLKKLLAGRLDRELATLARCDVMVIRYGLNDRKSSTPEQFKERLKVTCERVKARFPNVQLVVATTLPPRGKVYEEVTRSYAAEARLPLVDIADHFRKLGERGVWNWHMGKDTMIGFDTDALPPNNPNGLKGDIHPNAFGCRLIAEQVFHVISSVIERRLTTSHDN